MNANDCRNKTADELREDLEMYHQELVNLRLQKAFGSVKPHTFQVCRNVIARIKTILHQKKVQSV